MGNLYNFFFFLKSHLSFFFVVYGAHVATTVLPTIAEVLFNTELNLSPVERYTLLGFYAPYFLLPLIMVVDSFFKVNHYMKMGKAKTQ